MIEVKPGEAEALRLSLQSQSDEGTCQHQGQAQATLRQGLDALSKTLIHATQLFRNLYPGKTQSGSQRGSQLPMHTVAAGSSQRTLTNQDNRWLLLCIDKGLKSTLLYQAPLQNVTTDRDLFEFLRCKYYEQRKFTSWFTLRSIKSVALTKVRYAGV